MALLIGLAIGLTIGECGKYKFYDGEGNEVPVAAVKSLVMSQYAIIDHQDSVNIKKYFYFCDYQTAKRLGRYWKQDSLKTELEDHLK